MRTQRYTDADFEMLQRSDPNVEMGLTLYEARLFALLRDNAILRRESAYRAMYPDRPDYNGYYSGKFLNVFTNRLRRKLLPFGYKIEALRGIGWRLIKVEN